VGEIEVTVPECEAFQRGTLEIKDLGLVPYSCALALQRELHHALRQGAGGPTLIFCEHPAVITFGRRAACTNILVEREELQRRGIDLAETDRGGDVTWHGPGQIVCYPILDLSRKRRDVAWYMRSLEESIIRTLQDFEIKGHRIAGRTGVWTGSCENDIGGKLRKIASLGVRISRWCTLHGFSLNVRDCGEGFALIHPCGFQDIEVSSMDEELMIQGGEAGCDILSVKRSLSRHFCEVFDY
jgi:lipoyl(octanoyl) transferase